MHVYNNYGLYEATNHEPLLYIYYESRLFIVSICNLRLFLKYLRRVLFSQIGLRLNISKKIKMKRLGSFNVYSLLLTLSMLCFVARSQLRTDFYSPSCPNVFKIVRREVQSAMMNEMRIAASLLRLQFHDCFVNVSITCTCSTISFYSFRP